MVLRETSPIDSSVQEVIDLVTDTLAAKKVNFRLTGGLLLNSFGVGRPTYDVDLIVSRSEWQKAVTALEGLSVSYERMEAPGEPEPAAILQTTKGPYIEIFPEGMTAGDVAHLRGRYRPDPAEHIAFCLSGDPLVNLINSKIASHLCATDLLQDLSDVQRLIKHLNLDAAFAENLAPSVRSEFLQQVAIIQQPPTRRKSRD